MRFNVAQLLKEPVGSVRDWDIQEDIGGVFGQEIIATAPLVGHAHLVRTNRGVFIEAKLNTMVRLTCSRCVEDYRAPVSMNIREEYLPTVDVNTGAPVPVPEGEDALTIDENHVLDLTEAVRQYILTALPIAPLCRVDCKGLCPQCGQNLNQATCSCEPLPPDSRMEVLRELLKETTDEEQGEEKDSENKTT